MWGMGNWIGRLGLLACVLGIAFGSGGVAQDAPSQPAESPQQTQPAPQPPHTPQSGREESNPGKIAAQKTKEATIEAADLTRKAGEAALIKARDWESGWVTGIYVPRGQQRVSLSEEQRRQLYLQQTLTTPGAYMKRMFAAGIDQVRGAPQQWDDGWDGYVERFASREGQFITANSLAALGNAALKYEPRYDQCRCRGLWRRTGHAVVRNFITYDRSEQHLRPQLALYGGAFGGGLVSTAWKPHPRNGFAEGGRAMLGQAGYGALLNLFIEFAGDINRKLGAKK